VAKKDGANASILIVDDDLDSASLLAEVLSRHGYTAHAVCSARECIAWLEHEVADVVVTDVQMEGVSGIELCQMMRERYPDLLTIVLTGNGGLDVAVAAMRAGAYDYLAKPVVIDALHVALARALAHLDLRREMKRLRATIDGTSAGGIAGESRAIRETLELVRRVANSDATILIQGESGTGKELIARAIHHLSPRCDQPFVATNCAAMPAPLLESELFGHVRGAFTDAKTARTGLIIQAGRGTLFLDEISEMPLEMQVKLLRVLQEHMVRPVGGDQEMKFQARVLASTNRDLAAEVADNRFREDLYYRVNVVAVTAPPLRARDGDILVLAHYFLRRIAARTAKPVLAITDPAARLLLGYDWPGNVRELENCMERAVALCRLDHITVDDLPDALHEHQRSKFVVAAVSPTDLVTLHEMERRYVHKVLTTVGGNKTVAARVLGIDRRSVYRRLEPIAVSEAARDAAD
jgi:DNA-binding NtrC family response regulator